jgi:hypothetical protein
MPLLNFFHEFSEQYSLGMNRTIGEDGSPQVGAREFHHYLFADFLPDLCAAEVGPAEVSPAEVGTNPAVKLASQSGWRG